MSKEIYTIVKDALLNNDEFVAAMAYHAKITADNIMNICTKYHIDLSAPKPEDAGVMAELLAVIANEGIMAKYAIEQHGAVRH